jgi:hypothetical protein
MNAGMVLLDRVGGRDHRRDLASLSKPAICGGHGQARSRHAADLVGWLVACGGI